MKWNFKKLNQKTAKLSEIIDEIKIKFVELEEKDVKLVNKFNW